MVEEVSEEDELIGWQDTTPKRKLEYWDESEPSPLVAKDDYTESITSKKDSWTDEEEPDDSREIDWMALEDNDWEQTWMHQDDTPQSSQDPILSPNTKTQTSIPMQTRAQNTADDLKADYFWYQVLKKQHDQEELMDQLYPSGFENSAVAGPTYKEYTNEEWNDVLTHQSQSPSPSVQPTNKPPLSPADNV
eukprot:2797059-Ditylum_brightwellii.AAC.1